MYRHFVFKFYSRFRFWALHRYRYDSASAYQILYEIDQPWSYDVILILQDGGHSVANLLPVSGLATAHVWHLWRSKAIGIRNFDQISQSKYYYFRFLKTNGRHVEILLPVSILTFSVIGMLICIVLPNWMIADGRSNDVILILQNGGHTSQIYYRLLVSWCPGVPTRSWVRNGIASAALSGNRPIALTSTLVLLFLRSMSTFVFCLLQRQAVIIWGSLDNDIILLVRTYCSYRF